MADGGAAVSIAPAAIARKLGFKIRRLEEDIEVQYGIEGSKSIVTMWADFGYLIGPVLIVDDAVEMLISLDTMTMRGYQVVYEHRKVTIIDRRGRVRYQGRRDMKTRLWLIDVKEIVQQEREEQEENKGMEDSDERENRMSGDEKQIRQVMMRKVKMNEEDEEEGIDISENEEESEEEEREKQLVVKLKKPRVGTRKHGTGLHMTAEQVRVIVKLHMEHGHISEGELRRVVKSEAWQDMPAWMTTSMISAVYRKNPCILCDLANSKKHIQRMGSGVRELTVGNTLSVDYQGPYTPPTMKGCTGYFLFVDMATGKVTAILTRTKKSLVKATEKVRLYYRKHGHINRKLRVDRGKVECSDETAAELAEKGITVIPAPADSQEKDPVERTVQTFKILVSTLMADQTTLTNAHWGAAVMHAADQMGRRVNNKSEQIGPNGMSADEAVTGIKPAIVGHAVRFGQLAIAHTVKGKEKHGQLKGAAVTIVGSAEGQESGYKVVYPGELITKTRDQVTPMRILTMERTAVEMAKLGMKTIEIEGKTYETFQVSAERDESEIVARQRGMVQKYNEVTAQSSGQEEEKSDESSQGDGSETDADIKDEKAEKDGMDGEDMEEASKYHQIERIEAYRRGRNGQVKLHIKWQGYTSKHNTWEILTPELKMNEQVKEYVQSKKALTSVYIEEGIKSQKRVAKVLMSARTLEEELRDEQETMSSFESTKRQERDVQEVPRKASEDEEEEEELDVHVFRGEQVADAIKRVLTCRLRSMQVQEENRVEGVFKVKRVRTADNPTLANALTYEPDVWNEVVQVEVDGIMERLQEVQRQDIPEGTMVHQMMVDLTTKRDVKTGEVIKRKVRLNIRGDIAKRMGLYTDEDRLYAPTPAVQSMFLLFAVVVALGWHLMGFDIVGAYRHTPAATPYYVQMPRELTQGKTRYFMMFCVLYGLAEASREFTEYLATHMESGGYKRCIYEPSSYVKKNDEGKRLIVVVHADDGAIGAEEKQMGHELYDHLRIVFPITVQDRLESIVGLEITRFADGTIEIKSSKHTEKILTAMFGKNREGVRKVKTPMSVKWDEEWLNRGEPCDKELWMKVLGLLIWSVRYRFDIAYVVCVLSTRTRRATQRDMAIMRRVCGYILHTKDLGVTFRPGEEEQKYVEILFYCDAAHNEQVQSQMGTAMKIGKHGDGSGMVSVMSSKSKGTVAMSSDEAELNAATEVVKDAYNIRGILEEWQVLEPNTPSVVKTDSDPMIKVTRDFSKNGFKRLRHTKKRIHFIMQAINREIIVMQHMSTEYLPPDLLTKATTGPQMARCVGNLMGESGEMMKLLKTLERAKKNKEEDDKEEGSDTSDESEEWDNRDRQEEMYASERDV